MHLFPLGNVYIGAAFQREERASKVAHLISLADGVLAFALIKEHLVDGRCLGAYRLVEGDILSRFGLWNAKDDNTTRVQSQNYLGIV